MARGSHDATSASIILNTAITVARVAVVCRDHTDPRVPGLWAFCLVELCVGIYFPRMNFLKSKNIVDNSRANVKSVMRMPLSTFVELAHCLPKKVCLLDIFLAGISDHSH